MEYKFKLRDLKYVRRDKVVTYYIQQADNLEVATKLMKSLNNVDKLEKDTLFTIYDNFTYNEVPYVVIKCEYGFFVTRLENIEAELIFENDLEKFNIKSIISAKDKTILIDTENHKYMTTKAGVDEYDIEKAVMLLLLKMEGYTYKDITNIIKEVKYQ